MGLVGVLAIVFVVASCIDIPLMKQIAEQHYIEFK
jgi:hypothetical protein